MKIDHLPVDHCNIFDFPPLDKETKTALMENFASISKDSIHAASFLGEAGIAAYTEYKEIIAKNFCDLLPLSSQCFLPKFIGEDFVQFIDEASSEPSTSTIWKYKFVLGLIYNKWLNNPITYQIEKSLIDQIYPDRDELDLENKKVAIKKYFQLNDNLCAKKNFRWDSLQTLKENPFHEELKSIGGFKGLDQRMFLLDKFAQEHEARKMPYNGLDVSALSGDLLLFEFPYGYTFVWIHHLRSYEDIKPASDTASFILKDQIIHHHHMLGSETVICCWNQLVDNRNKSLMIDTMSTDGKKHTVNDGLTHHHINLICRILHCLQNKVVYVKETREKASSKRIRKPSKIPAVIKRTIHLDTDSMSKVSFLSKGNNQQESSTKSRHLRSATYARIWLKKSNLVEGEMILSTKTNKAGEVLYQVRRVRRGCEVNAHLPHNDRKTVIKLKVL
jgi:hypothetical protein